MATLIPKNGNDKVYTPVPLAKAIINHFIPSDYEGKILEPCRGGGAFYNNFPKSAIKDWCELDEGRDFLSEIVQPKVTIDYIITNPPFSIFRKFLNKAMDVSENVIFLCPVNHVLGLKARLRDIKEKNFKIKEIAFVETPKEFPSSGFAYAAIHLKHNYKSNNILTSEIKYGR